MKGNFADDRNLKVRGFSTIMKEQKLIRKNYSIQYIYVKYKRCVITNINLSSTTDYSPS